MDLLTIITGAAIGTVATTIGVLIRDSRQRDAEDRRRFLPDRVQLLTRLLLAADGHEERVRQQVEAQSEAARRGEDTFDGKPDILPDTDIREAMAAIQVLLAGDVADRANELREEVTELHMFFAYKHGAPPKAVDASEAWWDHHNSFMTARQRYLAAVGDHLKKAGYSR